MAHAADKEQIEMLSKWWQDYGRAILIAIFIGVIFGFGWKYWHSHKKQHRAQASMTYIELLQSLETGNITTTDAKLATLKKSYSDTPYSALGAMLVAQKEVSDSKLDQALVEYQWVIDHSASGSLEQIAQIRASRIYTEKREYQKALNILQPMRDNTFAPMVLTLKGDIYKAQGQMKKADNAYQEAKKGYEGINLDNPFIEMKLNL